jgi:hypothetical protein
MSSLRINSDHLAKVVSLIELWRTRGADFRNELDKVIGFKKNDPKADYTTLMYIYLKDDITHPDTTQPFNDPLPPEMEPDPNLRAEPEDSPTTDLPPYDPTDPKIIWRYTRHSKISMENFAAFALETNWPCTDTRPVTRPLDKDPEEVRTILEDLLIEERYFNNCDTKFRGLMELIVKAFFHWWNQNNPQPRPRKFGDRS